MPEIRPTATSSPRSPRSCAADNQAVAAPPDGTARQVHANAAGVRVGEPAPRRGRHPRRQLCAMEEPRAARGRASLTRVPQEMATLRRIDPEAEPGSQRGARRGGIGATALVGWQNAYHGPAAAAEVIAICPRGRSGSRLRGHGARFSRKQLLEGAPAYLRHRTQGCATQHLATQARAAFETSLEPVILSPLTRVSLMSSRPLSRQNACGGHRCRISPRRRPAL